MSARLPADRPIELVIFDCDGVLIDSEVISQRSTAAALAALDFALDEAEVARRFVGRSYASIREEIEAEWGRALPPSFEADVERQTLETMARSLLPVPGVGDALARLELHRCVASSSSVDWITRGLEKTGLIDHLAPHFYSASMVENGKPAPDIFLHAADSMGVAPARALVVEDSLPGVQAGVAAGAIVIGFTGGSHIVDKDAHGAVLREAGASMVIEDMAVLPDLLANRL